MCDYAEYLQFCGDIRNELYCNNFEEGFFASMNEIHEEYGCDWDSESKECIFKDPCKEKPKSNCGTDGFEECLWNRYIYSLIY
jgi:hypothetical protein